MPNLFTSKCNKCDFETSISSGADLYVRDESGQKVICPHPAEHYTLSKVLKISVDDALNWLVGDFDKISEDTKTKIEANVGMDFQYLCLDCLDEVYLDKKTEALKCDQCGSTNIKYVADLVNQSCPKCHQGTVLLVRKGIS